MVLHPEQPMVVDLELELRRDASTHVVVIEDDGVRVQGQGDAEAGSHTLRLRGLAPETEHTLELEVSSGGAQHQYEISFTTPVALPGFEPGFAVTGAGVVAPDYRLFDVTNFLVPGTQSIYVLDPAGQSRWFLPAPGTGAGTIPTVAGVKLLSDGTVVYLQDANLQIVDELGERQLSLGAPTLGVPVLHHEVVPLPVGTFLVLGRSFRDIYYQDLDQTLHVAGDTILELTAEGEILWTWDCFDHLDPGRRRDGFEAKSIPDPENGTMANDWTHANGLEHDPVTDTILLSLRHQDWIIKIDHQTGEVMWRLGEEGDFTLAAGAWFYHPHSPQWQPDGSLLLYDNDAGNPTEPPELQYSRPVRYALDEAAMTANEVWEDDTERYNSPFAGDADRLSNGNILVLDSALLEGPNPVLPGRFRMREIDGSTGEWVWQIDGADGIGSYRAVPVMRLPGEPEPTQQ